MRYVYVYDVRARSLKTWRFTQKVGVYDDKTGIKIVVWGRQEKYKYCKICSLETFLQNMDTSLVNNQVYLKVNTLLIK